MNFACVRCDAPKILGEGLFCEACREHMRSLEELGATSSDALPWKPSSAVTILQTMREFKEHFECSHADWLAGCRGVIDVVPDANVTKPTLHVSPKDYEAMCKVLEERAR